MKIVFTFWYYKAVQPGNWVAELSDHQWHEFRALDAEDRKEYIQWLFQLDYLSVREMWWIPLDDNTKVRIAKGVKVLKREPSEAEIVYRNMWKKYVNTTYGQDVLKELSGLEINNDDFYRFIMYAHEHKRRFHICYDRWEEEPDKNRIIFVGRLADDTGYMYLYK